ncbi:MAG: RNA polymerase sigma factor, partial [Pseudomonadota bacterium]
RHLHIRHPWVQQLVDGGYVDGGYVHNEPIDPGPVPDQYLEIQERDRQLADALLRLSVDQRQIVVLRDYLDLPYAEIADVLGIAPGTVMSRLHRARLALREALGGSDDE